MSDPKQPTSFATLLKLYLRGLLDQQRLLTDMLENLVELAETQQAHSVLIEMTSEAIGSLDEDIEMIARYLHIKRPSQARRDGDADDGWPGQNGAAGDGNQPSDEGED
jgi:hypothetical protein